MLHGRQSRNNVATLCCAKNRCCDITFTVTLTLTLKPVGASSFGAGGSFLEPNFISLQMTRDLK